MREAHFELTDDEFEKQFTNCVLSESFFSHEAHLRLAWIHISKYGLDQALENVQAQLQRYVKHVGAEDKYHCTLTTVGVRVVYHFLKRSEADDFASFIAQFPRLKSDFKGLIESHYSFNVFSSAEAKNQYVEPDLLPFC